MDVLVSSWLDQLFGLLHEPLAATAILQVSGPCGLREFVWVDGLPASMQVTEGDAPATDLGSGWLIRLEGSDEEATCLFVASQRPLEAHDRRLLLSVALARIAWRLRRAAPGPGPAMPAELADPVHAVRNALNAVRMGSAVILDSVDRLPESLQPIAEAMDAAAARSVQSFNRLGAMLEPQT